MDRSLVEMKRSRSGTVRSRGIGTTVEKKPTTSPRKGTVADLPYWQNIGMNAAGMERGSQTFPVPVMSDGRRFQRRASPVTVPMELVCTRRTMPAADVTRNRPS